MILARTRTASVARSSDRPSVTEPPAETRVVTRRVPPPTPSSGAAGSCWVGVNGVAGGGSTGSAGGDVAGASVRAGSCGCGGTGDTRDVFVVKDARVERRAVRVGAVEGTLIVVLSGLAAGEQVIVEPPAELTEGKEVVISEGGN